MKIGLISDVHATVVPVRQALEIFFRKRADMVFCAGDIAGYGTELKQTAALLSQSGCISILGNHDAWYLDDHQEESADKAAAYLSTLPVCWDTTIEGIPVHGVHASPPASMSRGIHLLDEHGNILPGEKEKWGRQLRKYDFEVLIVGHTHQYFAERLGGKLVINPGSTKFNHTCALFSVPDKKVTFHPLGGRQPVRSWNWGMMVNRKTEI